MGSRRSVARWASGRVRSNRAFAAYTRGELGPFLLTAACRRLGSDDGGFAYRYGLVERPNYAYGVRKAAALASKLGYPGVTVVEFGVAGGVGLLALERHAAFYSRPGCQVSVVGFDLGTGLPRPTDHRDLPYLWSEGSFTMDEPALRARLQGAELVLGDVRDTIPKFLADHPELQTDRPIGFAVFDLDYWSSTASALDLFRGDPRPLLPRVDCFFDDVIRKVPAVGQMLAIDEFNAEFTDRHLGRPFGLRDGLPFKPGWADRIFEAHFFGHPDYNVLVEEPQQRPLPRRRIRAAE